MQFTFLFTFSHNESFGLFHAVAQAMPSGYRKALNSNPWRGATPRSGKCGPRLVDAQLLYTDALTLTPHRPGYYISRTA